jgi:transcriptional regulator with XRE-family HTH domain
MGTEERQEEIGRSVRDRRESLGLTQEQLAVHAEVSGATIRNIEAGRIVRAGTIRKVTRALDQQGGMQPYDGTDRRYADRRHSEPPDDPDSTIARLVELSPQELARVLLRLPEHRAQQVLAAYYQFLADRAAQSDRPERRIR